MTTPDNEIVTYLEDYPACPNCGYELEDWLQRFKGWVDTDNPVYSVKCPDCGLWYTTTMICKPMFGNTRLPEEAEPSRVETDRDEVPF